MQTKFWSSIIVRNYLITSKILHSSKSFHHKQNEASSHGAPQIMHRLQACPPPRPPPLPLSSRHLPPPPPPPPRPRPSPHRCWEYSHQSHEPKAFEVHQ